MFHGLAEDTFGGAVGQRLEEQADLVLFSPPYPLNRKKRYDNLQGEQYKEWLAGCAPLFKKLLKPTGSLVVELGNAWEPGEPVMSLLALEALIAFVKAGDFVMCQQFVCHNPARLPSPAQWVTIERTRVKDSYTHVWWMARTPRPKANNREVLTPYSSSMRTLIDTGKYNSGKRPSEYVINETSFLKDNGGAIPSNVLSFSNTSENKRYRDHCKSLGVEAHPARMPKGLAEFFIKFLTSPGDLVVDPFGGSNTTGAAAEELGRLWVATEPLDRYIQGSRGRFDRTW